MFKVFAVFQQPARHNVALATSNPSSAPIRMAVLSGRNHCRERKSARRDIRDAVTFQDHEEVELESVMALTASARFIRFNDFMAGSHRKPNPIAAIKTFSDYDSIERTLESMLCEISFE
jgi:hypothetical protein